MLKLVVCVCALAVCYAQDHLTCSCSKPAEIFTHSSSQASMRNPQGPPGKLGPKGMKGEPGIPDNQQINLLRGEFKLSLLIFEFF